MTEIVMSGAPKGRLIGKFKTLLPFHLDAACQSQREAGVDAGSQGDMLTLVSA